MFTPEMKIKEDQVQINKIDWPRSGWPTRRKTIPDNKIKEEKYEKFMFFIREELIIWATIKIKKGLMNSIGWKRKPKKFNHLFAPLTSTPITGTKNKAIKKIKKIGIKLLFISSVLSVEIKIINEKEINVYKKCFWKKK